MKRFYPLAWWSLALLAVAARLAAQDVTVAPLAWLDPRKAPEALPVQKDRLDVEFPPDLRKTADIGWAMIDASLDEQGAVKSWVIRGTQPAYKRAVELGDRGERKFKPGRQDGHPVSTRIRLTVIFNPASAGPRAKEATPRLLDAAVVVDPRRKTRPQDPPIPPEVVWAVVSVDAQGGVTAVKGSPGEVEKLLEKGVRTWRFAPARRAGAPVAADVRVPFIVVAPAMPMGGNRVPPRVLSRRDPIYPIALRRSGLRGDVVVEFIVDPEGRVHDATVVRTLNPAFNEPALEAVRRWRFEPGRVDGRAVNTRMQQPISFSLDMEPDGGGDGLELRRRGDPAKLPEGLKYDTPPKIDALAQPEYPYELLRQGVSGSAEVSLLIDRAGKVAASKVLRADRPEFGYALQAAAELFEYQPALKDGQPAPTLIGFRQDFGTYESPVADEADRDALALERKHPERIFKAHELDQRLKVEISRPPIFPRAAGLAPTPGKAVVEFLVDQEGVVRLPRIVSASDPVFGYAAVQAVSGWRFNRPTSKGKPGVTHVRVPFDFVPPAEPAAAAKP